MKHDRLFRFSSFIVVFLCLGMIGCGHKQPKADAVSTSPLIEEADLGSSDQGRAMGLQTVHFGFDSNLLSKNMKSTLAQDAEILKSNPNVRIQIEGHCDSRGGIQYNIALGERRANSVKSYLEDLGVSGQRLAIISYGKERPLVSGETEEAYAKNRRANFIVTAK